MTASSADLEALRRAAQSPDPDERGHAMQALLNQVRGDASLQSAALPIFRAVIANETHAWPGILAARGIELIEGPLAARDMWLDLLHREPPQLVLYAAMSMDDPCYVPALIELLRRRAEPHVRHSAIRALGRIKDPAVVPALAEHLHDPQHRAAVLEALGDQGDRGAIPLLETVLDDDTETGEWDDRGAPIRMRYLAWDSIRRMNEPDFDRHYRRVLWQPFEQEYTISPVPKELEPPYRPAKTTEAIATPSSFVSSPPPQQPSYSRVGHNLAPPTSPVPPTSPPVAAPGQQSGGARRKFRLITLLPLVFAVIEFMWAFFLLILIADSKGQWPKTRAGVHTLDAVGMVPGVIGILIALALLVTGRARPWLELICVVLGLLLCLPFVYEFGYELTVP